MTFAASFKSATDAVMEHLAAATSCTEGKNCFRYYLPPSVPVWALFLGDGYGEVAHQWHGSSTTEMHMGATVIGQHATPEASQAWSMQVFAALPMFNTAGTNIQWLRIRKGGMPSIKFDVVRLANDVKDSVIWECTIGLECVFNTATTFPTS